jgi:hypothetical protein
MSEDIARSLRIVGFRTEYAPLDPANPLLGMKATEFVDTTSVGNGKYTVTPQRIADAQRSTNGMWDVIRPHYEAWKSGQDVPANGTPLAAWPAIRPEQIAVLRQFDIKTVEDLASLTDSILSRPGMTGLRSVRDAAVAWEKSKDTRAVAADVVSVKLENEALKQQMADLMALLGKDNTEEPVKRRPGRPRKEDSDDAEAA